MTYGSFLIIRNASQNGLSRITEILLENAIILKIDIKDILKIDNFDMLYFAARNNHLNIFKSLIEMAKSQGEDFLKEALEYENFYIFEAAIKEENLSIINIILTYSSQETHDSIRRSSIYRNSKNQDKINPVYNLGSSLINYNPKIIDNDYNENQKFLLLLKNIYTALISKEEGKEKNSEITKEARTFSAILSDATSLISNSEISSPKTFEQKIAKTCLDYLILVIDDRKIKEKIHSPIDAITVLIKHFNQDELKLINHGLQNIKNFIEKNKSAFQYILKACHAFQVNFDEKTQKIPLYMDEFNYILKQFIDDPLQKITTKSPEYSNFANSLNKAILQSLNYNGLSPTNPSLRPKLGSHKILQEVKEKTNQK